MRYNKKMSLLEAIQNMNWTWIGYISISWFIIFIFMVLGFNRFKKCTSIIAMILLGAFVVPSFLINMFSSGSVLTPDLVATDAMDALDIQVKIQKYISF